MSLDALPTELYAAILSYLPEDSLSSNILALTRAIPKCPVPIDKLFKSIRLSSSGRFPQLQKRLRVTSSLASQGGTLIHPDARFIEELRLESWTADPQVVINLLALLSGPQINIRRLSIWVGPHFGPENLEEVLQKPRTSLEIMEIRFKPYLQRANYYTFLAGAYFDSSLLALARWPSSSLSSLSIVQDPFDHHNQSPGAAKHEFAQPIVFFKLTPLTVLATSRALLNVRSFRLRIPSRDVSSFLSASPSAFPSLELLDLSTCNVKDVDLERLLTRFLYIKHIILDRCALMRSLHVAGGEAENHGEWTSLGQLCALAGVKLAKEREKELKNWAEMHSAARQAQTLERNITAQIEGHQGRRARAGRKGLATATISLRHVGLSGPSAASSNQGAGSSSSPLLTSLLNQKLRIVPPSPSLRSLCTSPSPSTTTSVYREVEAAEQARLQAEFATGWAEGVAQLRARWKRLRTSQSGSGRVRVMCFSVDAFKSSIGPDGTVLGDSDPLRGLVEMGEDNWKQLEEAQWAPPILCLEGEAWCEERNARHASGCGHFVSRNIWCS